MDFLEAEVVFVSSSESSVLRGYHLHTSFGYDCPPSEGQKRDSCLSENFDQSTLVRTPEIHLMRPCNMQPNYLDLGPAKCTTQCHKGQSSDLNGQMFDYLNISQNLQLKTDVKSVLGSQYILNSCLAYVDPLVFQLTDWISFFIFYFLRK